MTDQIVTDLARAYDPEAFRPHGMNVRVPGSDLTWSIRRTLAERAAERAITAGIVAQIEAAALRNAADTIRAEAGTDELGMHQMMHEDELPQLSRVMLNGVTRAAERLRDRADNIENRLGA